MPWICWALFQLSGISAAGSVDTIRLSADVRARPRDAARPCSGGAAPTRLTARKPGRRGAPASDPIAPAGPIRFLQWRIILQSEQPSATPEVAAVIDFGNGRQGYTAGGKNRRFRQPRADTKLRTVSPTCRPIRNGDRSCGSAGKLDEVIRPAEVRVRGVPAFATVGEGAVGGRLEHG